MTNAIEVALRRIAADLEILPGLAIPVARAGHLVVLKLLARDDETRPQDASDLIALRPVLSTRDRVDAEEAVKLVVKRGYHRARDLAGLLSEYLSSG